MGASVIIEVSRKVKKGVKMKKNLVKKFFRFVIPSILSMLAFSLYTMVDGMFVAKGIGEKALAAVNLSSPYNSAMFASGLLIAVGMSTVISIELGKGEKELARRLFTQNLLVSAAAALMISVVTLMNLEHVARFLGATEDTLGYVMEYVGIIAPFAMFFICAYNMEVLVKTDGTPQLSVIGVSAAGLANVVLDWLFVMKLGWGVKGAAFATGLAQVLSVVIYLVYFGKYSKILKFTRFRWNLRIYGRTLPLGVADGITEFSNGIVIFLFNQAILGLLGEDGVVSYTVVGYVNTLVLMMMSGTAQGLQPISSYHYGRGEQKQYMFLMKLGIGMGLIFGILGWAACQVLGDQIVALFIAPSSRLFEVSVQALKTYAWAFLFMGFNVVTAAFFTSVERAGYSFPISMGRGLVLPAAAVFAVSAIHKGEWIWLCCAAAEGLCLILTLGLMSCYLRRGRSS